MAYNFIPCARDQAFLPPPDVRDWLPADHIAWFVLDVVDQLDLGPFLAAYRADGHGRAAYDPRVLLAVLLYGYCTGIRSSRQIERRCREDIAFRVLSANSAPDHVTIARFRARHEQALAGLLVASLKLCAAAGLVRLGTVALDGTKLAANAAAKPTAPATSSGRLARLHAAKARLDAEAAEREQTYQARVAASIAKATAAGRAPKASYRYRPRDEAPRPDATANTTDPDSRRMHGRHGSVQGYNAQAIATTDQIIIAAGLTQTSNDLQQLAPMLTTTRTTLAAAGITSRPEVLLADSGYWSMANLTSIPDAHELLIAPAKHAREGKPRKDGSPSASRSTGLRAAMAAKLTSRDGKTRYALRKQASNRSSGRSKRFAAPAGSNDAAWAPAWPNGNCSAAPTTFSNSGVRALRPEAAVRLASSPRPMSGSGPHPPT